MSKPKSLTFNVSPEERDLIEAKMEEEGYDRMSDFIKSHLFKGIVFPTFIDIFLQNVARSTGHSPETIAKKIISGYMARKDAALSAGKVVEYPELSGLSDEKPEQVYKRILKKEKNK